MATIKQQIVDAIVAEGGVIVEPSPSKRYTAIDYKGLRLWIGRLGAIRQGRTIRLAKMKRGRIEILTEPLFKSVYEKGVRVIARGAPGGWDDDWYYE